MLVEERTHVKILRIDRPATRPSWPGVTAISALLLLGLAGCSRVEWQTAGESPLAEWSQTLSATRSTEAAADSASGICVTGCLAVDPQRIVEIHTPTDGRIVSPGTVETRTFEPTDTIEASHGGSRAGDRSARKQFVRSLRRGDRVTQGQTLVTISSPRVGRQKNAFVSATRRLALDAASLEELSVAHANLAAMARAARNCEIDRVDALRAEQSLAALGMTSGAITELRTQATRVRSNEPTEQPCDDWDQLELSAPRDGLVLEIVATVGGRVVAGEAVVRIADDSQLMLHVHDPDRRWKHSPDRSDGGQWQVRSASPRDRRVFALALVSTSGDDFLGYVDNQRAGWRPGQIVDATLVRTAEVSTDTASAVVPSRSFDTEE
jgi:hypothetical protein